ncbi:MAG: Ig-like domain-containing protein [Balneolaceae bacterium]|nr:Ig-like domain-containing protein [Balneolaceae bacterium]
MKDLNLTIMTRSLFAGLLVIFFAASCQRSVDGLSEPTLTNNPDVFIDGFSAGLEYFPYDDGFAKLDAFQVDTDVTYNNSDASMRIDVPNAGDPSGSYAGAAFVDLNGGRDLTEYDALTFYAKGSKAGVINSVGFGQGVEGDNDFEVRLDGLKLSTYWKKYVIPFPASNKLTAMTGMFWFAEEPENGDGYSFWVDDLKFEKLGNIAQPRPAINNGQDLTITSFVNLSYSITGFEQTLNTIITLADETTVSQDVMLTVASGYFDFVSSNPAVATVDENGVVTVVGEGTATITGMIDGTEADGSLTVISNGTFQSAPVPTVPADSVISIFSDAYTNVPVDYYNGFFNGDGQTTQGGTGFDGGPQGADIVVNGDGIINYTDLNFVGIGTFLNVNPVDATEMTHMHVDINVQESIDPGDYITIQLLNDVGGNETSGSIRITDDQLLENDWLSLDIPLADFGLADRSALGLIFFVSDATISNIYVDNIFYYDDGTDGSGGNGGNGGNGGEPVDIETAPVPTEDADSVISIFSDAYTNVPVDYYNGFFNGDGQTTLGGTGFDGGPQGADVLIDGDGIIHYTDLNFVGIGTGVDPNQSNSPVDVSEMSHIHVDIYVNEAITAGDFIRFQLINDVGGNESSGSVTFNSGALREGEWVSFDVPLSDFNLTAQDKIGLIFFVSDDTISDIFVDNIYYYTDGTGGSGGGEKTAPELPITFDDSNVIYAATTFNGTAYEVVDNPDVSGSNNTASKVGSITNVGQQWEGIYFDLENNINFANGQTITMDVYSTTAIPVLMKIEVDQGDFDENPQNHTGSGWEKLTFTFTSTASFPRLTIFMDGPGNSTGTFYIDNIIQSN